MNVKKAALLLIVALSVSFGAFANGTSEVAVANEDVSFTVEAMDFEPARTITVDPSDEILTIFASYGIGSDSLIDSVYEDEDGDEYTVYADITQEVNSEVAIILQENRDNVVDLIQNELESHLHRGGTEEANMSIAAYSFTAVLDYPQA